jgi:hypothetical protein
MERNRPAVSACSAVKKKGSFRSSSATQARRLTPNQGYPILRRLVRTSVRKAEIPEEAQSHGLH